MRMGKKPCTTLQLWARQGRPSLQAASSAKLALLPFVTGGWDQDSRKKVSRFAMTVVTLAASRDKQRMRLSAHPLKAQKGSF